jgi:hypothetical protein
MTVTAANNCFGFIFSRPRNENVQRTQKVRTFQKAFLASYDRKTFLHVVDTRSTPITERMPIFFFLKKKKMAGSVPKATVPRRNIAEGKNTKLHLPLLVERFNWPQHTHTHKNGGHCWGPPGPLFCQCQLLTTLRGETNAPSSGPHIKIYSKEPRGEEKSEKHSNYSPCIVCVGRKVTLVREPVSKKQNRPKWNPTDRHPPGGGKFTWPVSTSRRLPYTPRFVLIKRPEFNLIKDQASN